ncbi:MAG: BolA family transcriptional regulator [Bdellovibrionaceae bacterium]|nr:BolA family transcriptional regulator [Pseudobdellovibrionaceae bacterium]
MRSQRLNDKLSESLSPVYLYIEDESANHSVPEGAESHFKVIVVSRDFDALSKVMRHQRVYSLLNDEFKKGLHALSIRAYTLSEWEQEKSRIDFRSPECLGGSKKS